MSDIISDFKTDSLTIRKVFDGSNYFQIPDYQRPYSWGDEEIEQLWEDISLAFDSKDRYYFLGPVILAQTESGFLEVVDGQQRLTTLTILFCVLRDFYLEELRKRDSVLTNRIVNAVKSLVDDKYRLILITQAHYQNQFEQEILENVILPEKNLTKKEKEKLKYKFKNAALILKDRLEELKKTSDLEKLESFIQYIFENIVIITITCSSRVSAIRLFQTLNTRGLELGLADLTKSYLFSQIQEKRKCKQFLMSWRDIEKIAEDNEESVSDMLTYYGYYVLESRPKRALNEELEKYFKGKDSNKIVYEIKKFAEYYNTILNTQSKSIGALRYLRDRVFWKTLLTTAKMEGYSSFLSLCKELRRLYYSYWISNYTTAKTRDFSFKLIPLIKNKISIRDLRDLIDDKMKADRVLDWVREGLESDAYHLSWLKPLLVLIERGQTDESVFIEYGKDLHVDHILPEKWDKNKYWKKNWNKEDADFWIDSIGNLTLLSGIKNRKASNFDFEKKKKIYRGKDDGTTAFMISREILRKRKWTINHVKRRHKWLVNETARILDLKLPVLPKVS